jgi:trigger factor
MQVTELSSLGLKREYRVVFSADEIADRVQTRLKKLGQTIRMPGFRPGKAPLALLRKQYGRSIMGEVLEEAAQEAQRQAINDNQLKPALQPKLQLTAFDEGKDLELSLDVEVLPEVPEVEIEGLDLVKEVAPISDERIDGSVQRLARSRQKFTELEAPRPAEDGDQLVIDFEGSVDGTPFEGGSAKDFRLVLGAGNMIPGFEAGLVGASAGEEKEIDVTFPETYGVAGLQGKAARFKVTVKEIKAGEPLSLDDAWAKELGFETLEEVRNLFRQQIEAEHGRAARMKMKRALFDIFADRYRFEVPDGLVEIEFDAIWKQVQDEMKRTGATFEGAAKGEDEVKAEYRRIADRRVRLGLLLSDVGVKNDVRVESEELQRAAIARAQQFPGREREIFEAFQKNQAALEQLRAPIYEDKVVDLIFAKAKVEEKQVTEEELLREPEDDELVELPEPAAAAAPSEPASESETASSGPASETETAPMAAADESPAQAPQPA